MAQRLRGAPWRCRTEILSAEADLDNPGRKGGMGNRGSRAWCPLEAIGGSTMAK